MDFLIVTCTLAATVFLISIPIGLMIAKFMDD